ncbi:PQQ-binding-like beta-propeller repeat protein [Gimesia sp.]|uniref:outer membrane protein assembly factor BamB family protein n=1 Tax=Gimesia sp. TaxID=2024833 RepID=UPI0025C160DB|nr:PQQ-binding-like beta-propeller repeat protein [Gimesia sp.]|tara:strand:- start:52660 stop:56931 length:4272 start_codon:yes stop_codon:yes gene_type:complete
MWRYDAGHTASTPHDLPHKLAPLWSRSFGAREQVWDDPLNNDLMTYDKILEPVVVGKRMYVGFNDADKLIALNTETGRTLWTFFAEGPIRFSPVATEARVYLVSDDGYLYCLDSATGKLVWKFRGAPSAQKALGNKRVISAWPARGGPVLYNDTVYFAASIWPFMGTFIYALDAESGNVIWVNDSTSASYIKQPHSAPSFAGVAPQGTLVATEELLLVPGGRSVPAALDRKTGKLKYFHLGGKGNGGSFVIAGAKEFFVHTRYRGVRAYHLETGFPNLFVYNEPVLHEDRIYSAIEKDKQPLIQASKTTHQPLWTIAADGRGDLIRAGNRLYAAGDKKLAAIQLPASPEEKPELAWEQSAPEGILRLLSADNKLFAVTLEGDILALGTTEGTTDNAPEKITAAPATLPPPDLQTTQLADALLKEAQSSLGYVICYGADHETLFDALLAKSDLQLIVIEENLEKINRLRVRYDALGLYGSRISAHRGTPASFQAPQHIARLTLLSNSIVQTLKADHLEQIYRSVRPYGGVIWVPDSDQSLTDKLSRLLQEADLPQAQLKTTATGHLISREGALPDSADWTHQYGDIANTVKSNDKRVKLPLGVLWFGGNTHEDILPRHGHGPPEQVIGGRTFLEGMNSLSARDVYTGQVLWRREFEDLGTFGIYFNSTYEDTPLSTQYNQRHIPGANARGTNYIATADEVYLAMQHECHVLDARDGSTKRIIKLPDPQKEWAFIAVYDAILLAGNGFGHFGKQVDEKPGKDGPSATDLSASQGLIAYDRHSGEILWQVDAIHSFLHNAIVAGNNRIYCLDKLPASAEKKLSRRGLVDPSKYRIVCFDVFTGKELWSTRESIFGSWLGYSEKHDLLLQAGARAKDRLSDEIGQGMIAYHAKDGSIRWENQKRKYTGPCVLHNDLIITSANSYEVSGGAFNILDGTPYTITNPITRQKEPLKFSRSYGCNYVIASENLLTFRSGAAGFYDLQSQSGTGNFGGFKSSCTSNLVVANGVLNAPDYTRTCSCSYQNQTSLALIHMPEIEFWTNSQLGSDAKSTGTVKQAGINFGAPGDRSSENGTLWLDYPSVGGRSPDLKVTVSNKKYEVFRHHALKIQNSSKNDGMNWVAASGIIDPQKITIAIQQDANAEPLPGIPIAGVDDDAEEDSKGEVKLHSSDLELGLDAGDPQVVGVRFSNVPLSADDQVESAWIQFTVDETGKSPARLKIEAEAASDAAPFVESKQNLSSRKRTKANVEWSPPAWMKVDVHAEDQATPDLKALLQEIQSQPGWSKGNSICFLITGKGTRIARSYKGASSGSARLVLKMKGDSSEDQNQETKQLGATATHYYTVKLTFTEPDETVKAGQRSFHINLQGDQVQNSLDIRKQTGQAMQSQVLKFEKVPVEDRIEIELTPTEQSEYLPVISGIELISENRAEQ